MNRIFLHGLESSGKGTKGKFLQENFKDCLAPDFGGDLEARLEKLEEITEGLDEMILVGSSFGGLMAAHYAIKHPTRVRRLVLMAPALNFLGFTPPEEKLVMPVYLLIGSLDDVTPASKVVPLAEETFSNLEINIVEEDHLLHKSFPLLDWKALLS